jgi:acylaminoacyl-peptidase
MMRCLSLLALAPAFAAQDELDLFEPLDVFELEYAADPQVSPNRAQIVYERRGFDVMTDRGRSDLWMHANGEHRPLVVNARSPRWSPDGRRLAYISLASNGATQLFVRWMDTGQTVQVTRVTESPSQLAWSPDGYWLAFTMHVPAQVEPLISMPAAPQGAEWAPAAKVIETLRYRSDGAGYLPLGHEHVFAVPAEGGTPRQVTSGDFDHGGCAWLPSSGALVVSVNRRADRAREINDSDLYEVALEDGSLTQLTRRYGPDEDPVVSPDGARIAYLGYDDRKHGYNVSQLYVLERAGGEPRSLTRTLDRSIGAAQWADDETLVIQYADHGETKLATVSLDGDLAVVAGKVGGTSLGRPYASGSFHTRAGGFVYTSTHPGRPSDLVSGDIAGKVKARLTALNEDLLGHKTLADVRPLEVESTHDGRPIQAWVATPPGFDPEREYPLILEIHGGPFADYGDRFSAEVQLYAAAGYVVVYANPRGSAGYGEEFGNLIHHAYPGHDYDDLMSVVDAVVAQGFVDEHRLYVTGGSGGGVLTAWIVGTTTRFRAAVVAKPVINWTSFTLTSDAYDFFYQYWFPGPPWEHQEQYWRRSPLSRVGHVETPTMLITGEADYRTPISESEQYYQALQLRGIETAFVRIPEASHGIAARPSHMLSKVLHVLAWFGRHGGSDD